MATDEGLAESQVPARLGSWVGQMFIENIQIKHWEGYLGKFELIFHTLPGFALNNKLETLLGLGLGLGFWLWPPMKPCTEPGPS